MNRFHQILCFLLALPLFFTTGCKENPVACGANYNYAVALSAEAQAFSTAAAAYAQDQSTANCNAYVKALEDYLKAAEEVDNCVPAVQREEYLQAIQSSRDSLSQLNC